MYCQSYVWARDQFSWQSINPWGPIFFLVGKFDKVIPHEFRASTTSAADAMEMQAKKNWRDVENLWVTIDPQTGLIVSSHLDDVYDATTDPALLGDPSSVRLARLTASRNRRSTGGR
jgi:hypothetical protein